MYYFTELAVQLNEPEEGVAPTDSRRRPDQRLMEEGRWDEAPAGIHCVTHLRFMTLHSIRDLMARSGLEIEHVARTEVPCPPQWLEHWQGTSNLAVDSQSLNTYAYLVRAHKQP